MGEDQTVWRKFFCAFQAGIPICIWLGDLSYMHGMLNMYNYICTLSLSLPSLKILPVHNSIRNWNLLQYESCSLSNALDRVLIFITHIYGH